MAIFLLILILLICLISNNLETLDMNNPAIKSIILILFYGLMFVAILLYSYIQYRFNLIEDNDDRQTKLTEYYKRRK